MRITLNEEQKAHCAAIGIANPPEELDVPDHEWHHAVSLWRRVGSDIDHELKAVGHLAWQKCRNVGTEVETVTQQAEAVAESKPLVSMKNVERLLALIAFLLVLLVSETAHCQWSQIKTITFQNSDNTVAGLAAGPFTIRPSSGTWSRSGTTWTLTVTAASGSVAWDAITNPLGGGLTLTQFANGNTFLTVKRKTDTTPTGAFFDFQNALGSSLCKLDIAGAFVGCSFPYANLTGVPALPANTTATSHQFFSAYNSTTGAFTKAEPSSTDLADFSTTAATTSGKIPIYDSTATNAAGGTGAYVPGDPLVQGLVAPGSTSIPNPVVIGGSDYGGTPAVRTAKVDASGNVSVTPTTTPNPSNLDVAASTLAKETGGNLAAIKTDVDKIPAQGQALAAASMPVVLPAAQITTLTPPAAITNFANETGGNLAAIKTDVDKIPALGQALAASSVPVVLTAAQLSTLTPLSTVTTTPPANASTNIAQVAGTTVDTNSGNKSAGTQRFVLATDQPNLTTPLNVNCTSGCVAGGSFADSSAFTFATSAIGNMGAVVDDVATNTVAENSAGAVRMNTNRILYVDLSKTAANTNKLLVTPDSVALPANQSVNVSQINGVTPLMGNGATGTGSQRVTIASDNTAFPVNASGTLGDNGATATTNRVGTLPAIAQATPAAAATAGRDVAVLSDLHRVPTASIMPTDFPSYTYNKLGLAVAASATDVAVISGNASNAVVITKIQVSCTQTTAGIIDLALIKRSTADTSGTSTSITAIPLDSNNAAATSAMLVYTVNPTTGTPVGTTVDSAKIGCMATGTAAPNDIYIWRPSMGQAIVLRGTAQQLAINLNGATVTGGSFNITIQTMELTNY